MLRESLLRRIRSGFAEFGFNNFDYVYLIVNKNNHQSKLVLPRATLIQFNKNSREGIDRQIVGFFNGGRTSCYRELAVLNTCVAWNLFALGIAVRLHGVWTASRIQEAHLEKIQTLFSKMAADQAQCSAVQVLGESLY